MQTKKCSYCGKEKSLSKFYKDRNSPDGVAGRCKDCHNRLPDDLDKDEFVKLCETKSCDELGSLYSVSAKTITRWKATLRRNGLFVPTKRKLARSYVPQRPRINDVEPNEWPDIEPAGFPESLEEDFTKYTVLERDRLLVFGDLHLPYHDVRVLDMAFRVAERYGIRTGLLNGDFLDNSLFSPFPKTHPNYHDFIKDEVSPGGEILKVFMRQLDELYWLEANHERWLNKRVGGHFTVFQLMESVLGVQYSQYSYAYVESGGEEILVCHPKNYRKVPGSLPLELCGRYLKNVLCGHLHRLCLLRHASGQFWACEGGHCADTKKLLYKNKNVDLHGAWNPGFVMILDGWPHLIEPKTWDAYMTPYADIEKERREEPREPEEVIEARELLARYEANKS